MGPGHPWGQCVGPVSYTHLDVYKRQNSAMAARKKGWIDFDAGLLLDGHSMDEVGAAFFDYIIALASGETETRAERNGYREIALFKGGVTV